MEPLYRCVAGIDVHKKMLAVVVRAPQGEYVQRKFGTTKTEIGHLAAWLQDHQVSEVVMESTAQYWRPVWYGLEAHFKLHFDASVEDPGAARTEGGFPGRTAVGRPLALGRSGG